MEYKYLAYVTGRREYFDTVNNVTNIMEKVQSDQVQSFWAQHHPSASATFPDDLDEDFVVPPDVEEKAKDDYKYFGGTPGMWGTRWNINNGEAIDRKRSRSLYLSLF